MEGALSEVARTGDIERRKLRDIDVAFDLRGEGPRVVLVHGLAQDHSSWAPLQAALTDHTTLAYDIRGHGSTTLGAGEGTIDQLGGDLISLLESSGPATVVGFSLGGVVALWAASERPDLVEGVVALATSSIVGRAVADGLDEQIALFARGDRPSDRAPGPRRHPGSTRGPECRCGGGRRASDGRDR